MTTPAEIQNQPGFIFFAVKGTIGGVLGFFVGKTCQIIKVSPSLNPWYSGRLFAISSLINHSVTLFFKEHPKLFRQNHKILIALHEVTFFTIVSLWALISSLTFLQGSILLSMHTVLKISFFALQNYMESPLLF